MPIEKYSHLNRIRDEDLVIGEDVMIIDPSHDMFDRIGEIYKVSKDDNGYKISIIYDDGNVYWSYQNNVIIA